MNDEKRFSASTPTVPAPADGTPPERQTATHESFSEQVSQETKAQLDRIASGNDEAARFAARISSVRSGSIHLREFDSNDDIEIDQLYIQR